MDSELRKTSVRANSLEKKRFEMMLSGFDSAKRNVAVDIKKSQLDFKRRLKRYKDRQREILLTRAGPASKTMEEFVLKQLRRRSTLSHAPSRPRPQTTPHVHTHLSPQPQLPSRPPTSPRPRGNLSFSRDSTVTYASNSDSNLSGATTTTITTNTSTSTNPSSNSNSNSNNSSVHGRARVPMAARATTSTDLEQDEDMAKLSHCRRSKVDLRPCTAWSAVRNTPSLTSTSSTSLSTPGGSRVGPGNVRLLTLRGGSLGTPARQMRYLDEEEVAQRSTFYRFLLDGYRHIEHRRLQTLNTRVETFCGKHPPPPPSPPPASSSSSPVANSHTPPGGAGLVKVGVMSLPPGVPSIVRQAMRVRMSEMDRGGNLQRAKTVI